MTDRFSPSLPSDGKVEASLVRHVAGVALELARRWLKAAARPALVVWPLEFRIARQRFAGSCELKAIT